MFEGVEAYREVHVWVQQIVGVDVPLPSVVGEKIVIREVHLQLSVRVLGYPWVIGVAQVPRVDREEDIVVQMKVCHVLSNRQSSVAS